MQTSLSEEGTHAVANARLVHILLVDDNPADLRLTRIALERSKVYVDLAEVRSGDECMRYLRREAPYEDATRPDLILLDLNMPGMTGGDALLEIKADKSLGRIPVVILTSSQQEKDVIASYDAHASCYLVKPLDFTRFQELVDKLDNFWIGFVTFPPTGSE